VTLRCAAHVVLCATTLALAVVARAERTVPMGLDEGTPAAAPCPGKAYLAGISFHYDYSMSGLAPYCVEMSADGRWAGGARVVAAAQMSKPVPGGDRIDLFCPLDFFLVGFRGWSHAYGGHAIMQITLTCRNVQTGTLWEMGTKKGQQSLTEWRGGGCADNSVANGAFGRVNDVYVSQFGLTCALTQPAARELRDLAKLRNGSRETPSTRRVPALTRQSAEAAASEPITSTRKPPLSDAASTKVPLAPSKWGEAVVQPVPAPPRPSPSPPPATAAQSKRYEAPAAFGAGSR
jgi:hypothetical protein